MNESRGNGADALPEEIVMGGVTLRPGDTIGPYRYQRPLGRGGMSHVILGHDPAGVAVALKILKRYIHRLL